MVREQVRVPNLLLYYRRLQQRADWCSKLTCFDSYPGCACDVPSHSYTLSFEPNPEWSGFYAYGTEIQAYFKKFYEKYELARSVKLNTKVLNATWHEDEGECK